MCFATAENTRNKKRVELHLRDLTVNQKKKTGARNRKNVTTM